VFELEQIDAVVAALGVDRFDCIGHTPFVPFNTHIAGVVTA